LKRFGHKLLFHAKALYLLTLIVQPAFAQNFNPYFNFKHLNVENGLADNIVYHFLHDDRGYMWMGTRNGVSLYDGIRTINFQHDDHDSRSLSGNFITRILEDSNHQVWIGTNAGIDLFNRSSNDFTHFKIPSANDQPADSYCVLLGFANRTDLWFLETQSKAIKIFNTKTRKFKKVTTTEAVDGILSTVPNSPVLHIWTYLSVGTTHYIFRNETMVKEEHFFQQQEKGNKPTLVYHAFFQNDSTVWLSTAKGLVELNPVTNTYQTYNKMNREPVIETRFTTLSPTGTLWVSTGGYGIYTFDTRIKKFIDHFQNSLLDPSSIGNNNIVSMYFDRVGNIWCGSYGNGVSYANVEAKLFSKHLSKNEMDKWKKQNNIYWMGFDPEGNAWCVVHDALGFWKLDTALKVKAFLLPRLENGKPFEGPVYQLFFESKNSAWCLTDRGLFRYNTISNIMKQVDYPRLSNELFGSYWCNVMQRLHDGSLLFSTWGGLYRITFQNGKQLIEPFSPLNNAAFKSFDMLYEDEANNIYVNDLAEHVYVLSPSPAPGGYHIAKSFHFLPQVVQFIGSDTAVYLATNQGLFFINKNDLSIRKSPINEQMPFKAANMVFIKKEKIWIFGDNGLYYYDTRSQTGRLFTVEDGLPSNKFSEFCMAVTLSGECLAGTNNGILAFYPGKLKDIIYPPRPLLTGFYVNDSSKSFLANPQEADGVVLNHDQNTFSFDFSCISFQHATSATYQYKLENYDDRWINGGISHYTRYSKMPPGKYHFLLRIADAKGNISPYTKSLAVEIKKAYWQTTMFKLALITVVGLIAWFVIRWYLRFRISQQQRAFEKQQAIEKERTRIATDMHDDLGAGLSRIKFLSETIGLKKQMQQPVEEDISSIAGYANEMIGKMGEIVWALNEKNDSLSDLLSYTRSYSVDYLTQNNITCIVNAPSSFPAIFVSGEFRRNIYLTIKEALHNIVKHAMANTVYIDISIGRSLTIAIRDDGIGFNPAHTRPFSNGLNNMKARMKDIQGKLEILQAKGTSIILSVPLPA